MQELKDRAERTEFYEWVMRIGMTILFFLGIVSVTISVVIAIFTELIVMIPGILGGAAFEAMVVFPYTELKKLANRKDFFYVYGVSLDKFPHLAADQKFVNKMFDRIGPL